MPYSNTHIIEFQKHNELKILNLLRFGIEEDHYDDKGYCCTNYSCLKHFRSWLHRSGHLQPNSFTDLFLEHQKNLKNLKKSLRIRKRQDKNQIKIKHRIWMRNQYIRLFNHLSNNKPKCVRCGCDLIELLEVNHKSGNGFKLQKIHGNIFSQIKKGIIKLNDLELLCRPCNHIHYLEQKLGRDIPLKVVYSK